MILIADSGSFKTDWALIRKDSIQMYSTLGLNPYFTDKNDIINEIDQKIAKFSNPKDVENVLFFGAGCNTLSSKKVLYDVLKSKFCNSKINVDSDLLGAARGIFKEKSGIIGIIGTGTNSGIYDGKKIIRNIRPLGYILGDEGSGAWLGKELLQCYSHNQLPEELNSNLSREYNLNVDSILENLYNSPYPNRYLAGFTKFFINNYDDPLLQNIIEKGFSKYMHLYIEPLVKLKKYPIGIIGSIAYVFREILMKVAGEYNFEINVIVQSPLEGLINYYKSLLSR